MFAWIVCLLHYCDSFVCGWLRGGFCDKHVKVFNEADGFSLKNTKHPLSTGGWRCLSPDSIVSRCSAHVWQDQDGAPLPHRPPQHCPEHNISTHLELTTSKPNEWKHLEVWTPSSCQSYPVWLCITTYTATHHPAAVHTNDCIKGGTSFPWFPA